MRTTTEALSAVLRGMVEAVKQNYPRREIADASFQLQEEIESGKRLIAGVNSYRHEDEQEPELLHIGPEYRYLRREGAGSRVSRRERSRRHGRSNPV